MSDCGDLVFASTWDAVQQFSSCLSAGRVSDLCWIDQRVWLPAKECWKYDPRLKVSFREESREFFSSWDHHEHTFGRWLEGCFSFWRMPSSTSFSHQIHYVDHLSAIRWLPLPCLDLWTSFYIGPGVYFGFLWLYGIKLVLKVLIVRRMGATSWTNSMP